VKPSGQLALGFIVGLESASTHQADTLWKVCRMNSYFFVPCENIRKIPSRKNGNFFLKNNGNKATVQVLYIHNRQLVVRFKGKLFYANPEKVVKLLPGEERLFIQLRRTFKRINR